MAKSIILIPFAFKEDYETGVNISNKNERLNIYMKNCCVACASAKAHCSEDTEVALVSNYPPLSHLAIFLKILV